MKKYISIIAVMALIAAGCAKQTEIENTVPEEEITPGVEMVEYTITVSRSSEPSTKARLTYGDDVKADFDWEVGDKIDVWDSNSGSFKTFTCTDILISGDDDARFSATLPAGTYTWTTAYYPSGVATDETHVTFPAAYSDPTKVKPILVATYPASGDMYFKHLAAYVYFTVKNCPHVANKIVFSSDQVIAGTYEVNATTQALSDAASTSNSVEITYPEYDNYTFTLPIVPGNEHTFSIAVKDATNTYFQVDGTADYDLPRRTVINMAELEIKPDVILICDWAPGGEIAMNQESGSYYALPNEILTTDNHTMKFRIDYPTGVSVNYGRTEAGIKDLSGMMAAGATNSVILEDKGMYYIQFDFACGFYWCGWSNPYYINYNDDDFDLDGNRGLVHICGNYYGWEGDPSTNTKVRVYDLDGVYKTDPITVTPNVQNAVLVNIDDPDWSYVINDDPEYPLPMHNSNPVNNIALATGTAELADTDYYEWGDELRDPWWGPIAGFTNYDLTITEPTQIRLKEVYFTAGSPEVWHYEYYGLSTSGVTLGDGDVRELVLHGNPFTITTAGTYNIYYHYLLHKVFIVKKL